MTGDSTSKPSVKQVCAITFHSFVPLCIQKDWINAMLTLVLPACTLTDRLRVRKLN